MDDFDAVIKHLPDIAKVVTPVAAAIPFTGIVKRMLGPAADEVAEMWKDQIRMYRYGRQLKCIEKAERMAEEAGFTPKAVPPKILFPLLDGASMEEDETLHTMWAALLANASSEMGSIVRPSFMTTLREMASDEAELLTAIPSYVAECKASIEEIGKIARRGKQTHEHLASVKEPLANGLRSVFRPGIGEDRVSADARFSTCVQALENAGLIKRTLGSYDNELGEPSEYWQHHLTGRGTMFMQAVSPPKLKS